MFGYVTPLKMELKLKDYEKFKAYYCGLCRTIKEDFGERYRLFLNYDMTFLAVLLDALSPEDTCYTPFRCVLHPFKSRLKVSNCKALHYAAFCNVSLAYYKLLDDVEDEKSLKSILASSLVKGYSKDIPKELLSLENNIESYLKELGKLEKAAALPKKASSSSVGIDELSHPFAELTAALLVSFSSNHPQRLLWELGYNLGKWIYLIDAFYDLEDDIKKNRFNAINACFNEEGYNYEELYDKIKDRMDFILVSCASHCAKCLEALPLYKNEELLKNILELGLMEKIDKACKRSEEKDEKSL